MEPQSPDQPQQPVPPPVAAPPPSAWTQPLPPPPGGWAQPQQQAPQPPPGYVQQPGYAQPGYPPPGYGMPMGAPPGMMWVPAKQPVTPLAKIGAVFMVIIGVLLSIVGAIVVIGGAAFSGNSEIPGFGRALAGAVAVFGVIILIIGVLHALAGIGSWRGAGVARVLAIILGILFGLIALAGAAGGTNSDGVSTSGGPISWLVAIGYIYTAIVLIFAWKQKPVA
jgi:hypothetical protein